MLLRKVLEVEKKKKSGKLLGDVTTSICKQTPAQHQCGNCHMLQVKEHVNVLQTPSVERLNLNIL